MSRLRSLVLFVSAAVVALHMTGPAWADRDAAGQDTIARTAYVIVLDDANEPVKDLTPAEIVILEDDVPRTVSDVKPAAEPLAIGLLVDTAAPRLGSIAPTRDLRTGLSTFVKTIQAANAESRFAVMQTGGAAVMSLDFTSAASDINRAITRLFPSQRTSIVVMEALVDMGKAIAREATPRRAIVSVDLDSQETSGVTPDEISTAVQTAGASLWPISIRSSGGSSAAREAVFDALTEITGGLRLTAVSPAALENLLATVAHALTSQYLVTYQRPGGTAVTKVRAAAARGSKVLATRVVGK